MSKELKLTACTADELREYVKNYPRQLDRHVTMICDPPHIGYYDFTLGKVGDWSMCVASYFHDDRDDRKYDHKICKKVPRPRT